MARYHAPAVHIAVTLLGVTANGQDLGKKEKENNESKALPHGSERIHLHDVRVGFSTEIANDNLNLELRYNPI